MCDTLINGYKVWWWNITIVTDWYGPLYAMQQFPTRSLIATHWLTCVIGPHKSLTTGAKGVPILSYERVCACA